MKRDGEKQRLAQYHFNCYRFVAAWESSFALCICLLYISFVLVVSYASRGQTESSTHHCVEFRINITFSDTLSHRRTHACELVD